MKATSLTEALAESRPKIGEPYSSLNDAIVCHRLDPIDIIAVLKGPR